MRISLLLQAPGTARYSPDPNGNGLSPRWINAALLTIATRRSDNGGPPTNGVVSKVGQGKFATAVRVGSGMSSSRAIHLVSMRVDRTLRVSGGRRKHDILRTRPKHQFAETGQVFVALDHCQEMVAGELAHLAGEPDTAVGEQDLGFTDPAWIQEDLSRRRVARVIFKP